MPPADGNLHGAQAVMTRQVEQFRVESEALNPLLLEEDGAAVPAKGFESTLRIVERQPEYDSNDLVENDSREFAGIIFNKIVRIVLWLPFDDTQCGFKAFRRDRCAVLFEQQRIERFGFDPELLYLARHHGLRAVEIPVRWGHSPATKVNMLRDS